VTNRAKFSGVVIGFTESAGTRGELTPRLIPACGNVDFTFVLKLFGAARAIVFAKNADEYAFGFGFFSGLAGAARLDVNHFAANVAINRVFNHQNLLSRIYRLKLGNYQKF
jgi:hypothetical protein